MKHLAPSLLLLLSLLFLLPGTGGKNSPGQGDEAMHIVTVQESLAVKSYLIPVLDGIPNYYKPPLLFWAGMATESLLGPSLLGARLPSVVFAVGTVILLYYLMVYWGVRRGAAFTGALAYLSTIGVMKFGRLLMMEQGMAFFFLAFVFLFLIFYRTNSLWALIVAGLVSGFAFLFKGPIFLVYCAVFLLAWAFMRFFRFSGDPVAWKGKHFIWPIVRTGIVYSLIAILPALIWILGLNFAGDGGRRLLGYFFVVENLGKFAQEDQSELRLLVGWLTYTFPWTLILLGAVIHGFKRQKIRNAAQLVGRLLLLTVILTTLLHVIPNRKAAYYGLPFMPLLFAAVPMVIRDLKVLESWAKPSLIVAAVIALVLAGVAFSVSHSWLSLGLALPALVLVGFFLPAFRRLRALQNYPALKLTSVAGILLILMMQLILYPQLNHEVIPVSLAPTFSKQVCVISSETWDGMDLKVLRPDANIQVSVPGSPVHCADKTRAVLVIPDKIEDLSMSQSLLERLGYAKRESWPIWKRWLNFYDVLEYWKRNRAITTTAEYYEP
ncbi:MAG: glycosyltransferase family 39 protein [Leptospirales bacterium]|nr:glycosyltransferase family 39 protein [Leptospirales bacterium]